MLDARIAKVLGDGYTPVNDHFLSILGPLLDAADQESEFERFEVVTALQYLTDASEEDLRHTLRGRFVWNHQARAIESVREELERNGNAWKPLKAGMFGGTVEEAMALIELLQLNVAKLSKIYS